MVLIEPLLSPEASQARSLSPGLFTGSHRNPLSSEHTMAFPAQTLGATIKHSVTAVPLTWYQFCLT